MVSGNHTSQDSGEAARPAQGLARSDVGGACPETGLRNTNRGAILTYIRENPGTNISSMTEALDLAWGTASWHLRVLIEEGQVVKRPRGRQCVLLPKELAGEEMEDLSILHNATARVIAHTMVAEPRVRRSEILARIPRTTRVINYHLDKLVSAGLARVLEAPDGARLEPTATLTEFLDVLRDASASPLSREVPASNGDRGKSGRT